MTLRCTRRNFAGGAAASLWLLAPRGLRAQQVVKTVAEVQRTQVLANAARAMDALVVPLLGVGAQPVSPLHKDFQGAFAGADAMPDNAPLRRFSATVCALAAAFVLTHEDRFAARCVEHLKASLFSRDFSLPMAGRDRPYEFLTLSSPDAVMGLVPLAESARATSILVDAMESDLRGVLQKNFAAIVEGLTTTEVARLARDTKDHRASAWLLIVTALARATQNQKQMDFCRVWFTKPTLRNQVSADGHFPQEVATADPYRNSLMNFDLLAGCAQLLTTPFDTPWNDELADGPGMRAVAAYLYPFIADRSHWGFPADATHFRDLPGRRGGLLLAGEAYHRPEYIETYTKTSDAAPSDAIAYSFPITQPLLWTARAPHGL